jgi:urease accessory protein
MKIRFLLAAAATVLASPALAHTGVAEHGHGLAAGLAHPLGGADHLLAMVAVGLWAGLVGGRAVWVWPAAFVTAMAAGGLLGMAGVPLPFAEAAIAASVIALGAIIGLNVQAPVALGAALCALFALFHGHAHGSELPAAASALGYAAGFLTATTALHLGGLLMARVMAQGAPRRLTRLAGAAMAVAGAGMLVG